MSSLFPGAAAQIGMSPDNSGLSYTPDQAAVQITRDLDYWGTNLGRAVNVTFAFRAHDATYEKDDASGFTEFSKAQIDAALLSFQSWSDVANIAFSRVGSGDTGAGAYSDSAKILLGDYTSGEDNAAAFTYLPDSSAEGGDVWVNGTQADNKNPQMLNYGQLTLTHEIGHAIGLEHPGDYDASDSTAPTYNQDAAYREDTLQYSVMSYFSETETGADFKGNYASVPLLDDIAAAQRLYGANMNTRVTDTVYGFNSTADRPWFDASSSSTALIFSIWDAGGHDKLDFSGYAADQYISLYAGDFSNVGGLKYNVSIAEGVTIEDATGGSGNDNIYGNNAANVLDGGAGNDYIAAADGDDTLWGGLGNNYLEGGNGYDLVSYADLDAGIHMNADTVFWGGNSDQLQEVDEIVGTRFADTFDAYPYEIIAGAGDDVFTGYWANEKIDGGAGKDTITFAGRPAADVDISATTSIEALTGSSNNDRLIGNKEANLISGMAGNDTLEGNGGADTLDGGAGVNTVSFAHATTGVRVSLPTGIATVAGVNELIRHISDVSGSAFNDVIVATRAHGVLVGGDGDDTFQLAAVPLSQAESVDGGAANDTINFSTARAAITISLAGANGEVLSSIEQVIGSAYADSLSGSIYAETLDGRGGDDLLDGLGGADHLIGSGGIDTVTYADATRGVTVDLSAGTDSRGATLSTIEDVVGTNYKDRLTGDGNANLLTGGGGADVLTGATGADTLVGGAANDTFVYTALTQSSTKGGIDLISDLQASDTIDLSAIDADKKTAGDQAFRIVDHFDKHTAELVLSYDATSGETRASMDTNGDGKADMVIRLSGDDSGYSHFVL